MSEAQDFIDSGILDEYCLGLLLPDEMQEVERMAQRYPDVQRALDQAFELLQDSENQKYTPSKKLKAQVLTALSQLGEPPVFDVTNLPRINRYSDSGQWQRSLSSIRPAPEFRNLYVHPLRNDGTVEQFILWVKQEVRPEDHHDEHESFLILEGECECRIGNETVRLSAGDFVNIPLDVEHTVRVLSPEPVKAIIQRVKLS